jgi:hypothetical protein
VGLVVSEIDELLTTISALSDRIDALGGDDPDRLDLEQRRDELRLRARALADAGRHPASIAAEIEMLENRLLEIDQLFITKGYSEKHLHHTIQDPGAYSHTINRLLEAEHQNEITEIRERLDHLRSIEPTTGA